MRGDEHYINKFPDDAAEIAFLVRETDIATAECILQVWGSKQRDIGSLKAIEMTKGRINARR